MEHGHLPMETTIGQPCLPNQSEHEHRFAEHEHEHEHEHEGLQTVPSSADSYGTVELFHSPEVDAEVLRDSKTAFFVPYLPIPRTPTLP